jgi:hypothetical protein
MRKCNAIALLAMLLCTLAATALAAQPPALAPGGRTIAGPGSLGLALNEVVTIYTDGSGNSDLCGTLVNTSKDASVRLTLNGGGAVNTDEAAGDSGALCRNGVTSATVTCLGPSSCTTQWRLDNQ